MGTFKEGGRPGGVLAAACNDAKQQKDVDVVICDTAGRLHTAYALMDELANCKKSIGNVLPKQPCETLLVLDGTTGMWWAEEERRGDAGLKRLLVAPTLPAVEVQVVCHNSQGLSVVF
jgi:fused signal recognition particle receptor